MMTSNVRSGIYAPKFCNLKLYNDGYKVSVSLHVSSHIYNILVGLSENKELNSEFKPILYRAKHYIHWDDSYGYNIPFDVAFSIAAQNLLMMKIAIREAKITSLQWEIKCEAGCLDAGVNPLMSL